MIVCETNVIPWNSKRKQLNGFFFLQIFRCKFWSLFWFLLKLYQHFFFFWLIVVLKWFDLFCRWFYDEFKKLFQPVISWLCLELICFVVPTWCHFCGEYLTHYRSILSAETFFYPNVSTEYFYPLRSLVCLSKIVRTSTMKQTW